MNAYSMAGKRVFVAGHRGMAGSAIVRRLASEQCEIVAAGRETVDLTQQAQVETFMQKERPHAVFLAAARVGGIHANSTFPAEFLYENLMIEANVIHAAWRAGVEKLVFLGSTCIYPRVAPQPIPEDALLTGPLEPTNEAYAIAKIAGIKLCEAYRRQHGCDFISLQPTNLFGPGDNYDLASAHVLPALLRKAHEAKMAGAGQFTVWGTGTPLREFMHVDDMADAAVFVARNYSDVMPVNLGSGEEISIRGLAELVCSVIGYEGRPVFDASKPDGAPRKLADIAKLRSLGWNKARPLRQGIEEVYAGYVGAGRSLADAAFTFASLPA